MQRELFEQLHIRPQEPVNLLPCDGEVYVYHSFFNKNESDEFLDYLVHHIQWQQDHMKFYGKQVDLPRLTAWYGDHVSDYSYSGISMKTNVWTSPLLEIKNRI